MLTLSQQKHNLQLRMQRNG